MEQTKITSPETGVNARIQLPSSKSICNRALIVNALSGGEISLLSNLSDCDDTKVTVQALQTMPPVIDIKAAGTAMRFLTAYLSATDCGEHIITGTERMKQRPIRILVDALRQLGAEIEYTENEGYPPLRIKGKILHGDSIELPGNVSSQYISALLMIGPALKSGLTLTLTEEIVSRPYIDMTLQLMNEFGASAGWAESEQRIEVRPVPYKPKPYSVESDWSAASYWYEIAALANEAHIELPGLKENSSQGDSGIAEMFRQLGVETTFIDNVAVLTKDKEFTSCESKSLRTNLSGMPDMAQTLVVACAMKGMGFTFIGLQSLKIKETDRISALIKEMGKLGYVIEERDCSDGVSLEWFNSRCDAATDAAIDTYEDHRMAMAFAPASLKLGSIKINNPQVVSKSYPSFWDDLKSANFQLSTTN